MSKEKTGSRSYYEELKESVNSYLCFLLVSVCFLIIIIILHFTFSSYPQTHFTFSFFQEFSGNSDGTTVVKHQLGTVAMARYVRFYALTYEIWPYFRVEIFVLTE